MYNWRISSFQRARQPMGCQRLSVIGVCVHTCTGMSKLLPRMIGRYRPHMHGIRDLRANKRGNDYGATPDVSGRGGRGRGCCWEHRQDRTLD